MIHPFNAQQIENITGMTEGMLPKEFKDEYTLYLCMYHKTRSGGGALPPELLIPLLRQFDLSTLTKASFADKPKVRWDQVAPGTRVIAQYGGQGRSGKFVQIVSGGTVGVKLDDFDRVLELRPVDVRLDQTIPDEINQRSMVDDETPRPDVRAKFLPKTAAMTPPSWSDVDPGTPVVADGKDGLFVGMTPDKPNSLTIDVGDGMLEFTTSQVKVVENVEA